MALCGTPYTRFYPKELDNYRGSYTSFNFSQSFAVRSQFFRDYADELSLEHMSALAQTHYAHEHLTEALGCTLDLIFDCDPTDVIGIQERSQVWL